MLELTKTVIEKLAGTAGKRLDIAIRGTELERELGDAMRKVVRLSVERTLAQAGGRAVPESEVEFLAAVVGEALTRDRLGPALLAAGHGSVDPGAVQAEWQSLVEERLASLGEAALSGSTTSWAKMVGLDLDALSAHLERAFEDELRARSAGTGLAGLVEVLDTARILEAIRDAVATLTADDGDHRRTTDPRDLLCAQLDTERYAPLSRYVIPRSDLIIEKTRGFIGRRFVFDAIDAFTGDPEIPSGYFVIEGEPGIGKSALMAHLALTRRLVHHFVTVTDGLHRPEHFLLNVCAQLIACYELDRPTRLPSDAGANGLLLATLLQEVSTRLAPGRRAVVLVDALDESAAQDDRLTNPLFLPHQLPAGIFFVVTTRPVLGPPLSAERLERFVLEEDSEGNRADVAAYVRSFLEREPMRARLCALDVGPEEFVEAMQARSEGNFMYLRHVLTAIEQGRLLDGGLADLPQGLLGYYERHWKQIRAADEDQWVRYRRPVIAFLSRAAEPVSARRIARWARIDPARALAALEDWWEFLHVRSTAGERRFRVYHASFQDFLADRARAGEIDLDRAEHAIVDSLLEELAELRESDPTGQSGPA
jgi:hypothetical protein